MITWLFCLESDPHLRAEIKRRAETHDAPMPSLARHALDTERGFIVWTCGKQSPTNVWEGNGECCAVFGKPHDAGRYLDAAAVAKRLHAPSPSATDGFFTAVASSRDSVVVGTDLLGIGPVYYWLSPAGVLVGSSVELFDTHPAFRRQFDAAGIIDLLATRYLTNGRTLQKDVRRLGPGRLLQIVPNAQAREIPIYRLPVGGAHHELPFRGQVRLLDEAMAAAVQCLEGPAIFLSGGLDSRLVAGYATKVDRLRSAVVLGTDDEHDAQYGSQVAHALGLSLVRAEVPFSEYLACAEVAARWEHLQNGFMHPMESGLYNTLRKLGGGAMSGLLLDAVVGGVHLDWVHDSHTNVLSFDCYWNRLNRYGFRPEMLGRMARTSELRDAASDVRTSLQRLFAEGDGSLAMQAWKMELDRQSTLIGRVACATTGAVWPEMPVLDRRLLSVAGNISAASLSDRRLEAAVLMSSFPALAEIPLDQNNRQPKTLMPRLRHILADHLAIRAQRIPGVGRYWRRSEPRRYVKTFDINNEGWRAVREAAEPARPLLFEWFERTLLEQHWPAPGVTVQADDSIVDTARLKSLVGLALLAKAWLAPQPS